MYAAQCGLLASALVVSFTLHASPSWDEQLKGGDAATALEVEPEYPAEALRSGTSGRVTVRFVIDRYGVPRDPSLIASEPPGVFDDEVLRTLRHWRFSPASVRGTCVSVAQAAEMTFGFSLLDDRPKIDFSSLTLGEKISREAEDLPPPSQAVLVAHIRQANRTVTRPREGQEYDLIPVHREEPKFPRTALLKGLSGYVALRFVVKPDGTVADVEVTDSEPGELFDDSALRALKRWRFQPKIVDGQPVSRAGCQTINYLLSPS